jgi:predicted Zn finger-like uncharacterized protein
MDSSFELDPLTTACPHCGRRFRVTEAQLQKARGRVRCGGCGTVFDGVDHLILDTPRTYTTNLDAERALDELLAELLEDTRIVPVAAAASAAPAAPAEPAASAEPDLMPPQRPSPFTEPVVFGRPPRRRLWIWPLLVVGALAVAAQVLWYRFDVLVRDPAWRPVYETVCPWVGCTLPVQRDIRRVRTRNLMVRAHESEPGRLLVQAMIINEADFPQPFPTLELRFTALSGTLVAGHRFQPAEYLGGDARQLELMPIGTPVQFELEIADPGEDAVNYHLQLR